MKPVAWRYRYKGSDRWAMTDSDPTAAYQFPERWEIEPLYAHPAPASPAPEGRDDTALRTAIHEAAGCHEHSLRTDRLVALFTRLLAPNGRTDSGDDPVHASEGC